MFVLPDMFWAISDEFVVLHLFECKSYTALNSRVALVICTYFIFRCLYYLDWWNLHYFDLLF